MPRPDNDPDTEDDSAETVKSDEMADADTANGEGDPTTSENAS
ncbi:MAG: hypothetical protein AB7Q42_22640 [Acidimicrobiia bacterium]